MNTNQPNRTSSVILVIGLCVAIPIAMVVMSALFIGGVTLLGASVSTTTAPTTSTIEPAIETTTTVAPEEVAWDEPTTTAAPSTTAAPTTTAAPPTTLNQTVLAIDIFTELMCSERNLCMSNDEALDVISSGCVALDDIDPNRTMSNEAIIEQASYSVLFVDGTQDEKEDLMYALGMILSARDDLCLR